jgi:enamine deaminase RidA (YjgF/YER057c/UK114 family)
LVPSVFQSRKQEDTTVKITAHNPWTWQDRFQFSQSLAAEGASRTIYVAGQVSADENGQLINPRDMAAQIPKALENVEAVLKSAGVTFANVVRMNFYVTDMAAFMKNHGAMQEWLKSRDAKPPGCALGIAALYHPDALIEIEVTAVA